MKISFITTVFNEEKTAVKFLDSLFSQSKLPHEIIIVDGGSTDATVRRFKNYDLKFKKKRVTFKVLLKKGNRSVGRNEAIKNATGDIIVCSDSGNILDKDWVKNIIKPFNDKSIEVVAGYYEGVGKTIFQKCLIPYVLVMPDKVNPEEFLPATRSVAFKKSVWKKIGGFPEQYSHNEDYVFAKNLKKSNAKIVFAKDAIVYWIPRKTFKEAFIMFFRFAFGDAEARILRTKVTLVFARYFFGIYSIFLSLLYRSFISLVIIMLAVLIYISWSIKKNYKYVRNKKSFLILPLLQFTADVAVMTGTILGCLKRAKNIKILHFLKNNKFLVLVLILYTTLLTLTLQWGIPNENHPFPYHMDEWHQFHAVGTTFTKGTPNTVGSANGTMFHFLTTGFYLVPFIAFQIIDPFSMNITNFLMRERVFEILRINSLLYGVFSIIIIYIISRKLALPAKLTTILFTITPIWLLLSSYFKYDIALVFWILLSMLFLIRIAKVPMNINFLFAAIPTALAFSVKVSAIPVFFMYLFSYFWFLPKKQRSYKYFFSGIGIFLLVVVLFGMPDTLFGKGDFIYVFYNSVIQGVEETVNNKLDINPYVYLFLYNYPISFGYGFMLATFLSIGYWMYHFLTTNFRKIVSTYKNEFFIFICLLIVVISILPLRELAAGNRSLVVLPFFVLMIGLTFKRIFAIKQRSRWTKVFVGVILIVQLYQSYAWIHMKFTKSPQEQASTWILENISKSEQIGIENIPIYQFEPDIIQKEFYFHQYKVDFKNRFTYKIVDSKTPLLPKVIVITNDQIESKFYKITPKNSLVERLNHENYKKVIVFSPDFTYLKTFANDRDYHLSGLLVAAPSTISVYIKEQ